MLIGWDGRFYLTDWGAAHRQGEPASGEKGTERYAAPEQLNGGSADARGDVYSLAAVAYRALTGEQPSADPERNAARLLELAGASGVTPAVAEVLARALSVDPNERPHSAHALVLLLHAAGASGGSVPPGTVVDDEVTLDDGPLDDGPRDDGALGIPAQGEDGAERGEDEPPVAEEE